MQPSHVKLNAPLVRDAGDQLSKNPDGKVVREVQSFQAASNRVGEDILIDGKDVRVEQPRHVLLKLVPDEVSSKGNDVSELQPNHAWSNVAPEEVLISGKDVREVQLRHVWLKFVPNEVSSKGNDVSEEQLYHA